MDDYGDVVEVTAAERYGLLTSLGTFEDFLREVTMLAAMQVGTPASCGLTVHCDGRPLTVASSDALATSVDEVQFAFDESPSLHALNTGAVVVIVDLLHDERWGPYCEAALAAGVRSSLSIPINHGGLTTGVLTLYAPMPGTFDGVEQAKVLRLADKTAGAQRSPYGWPNERPSSVICKPRWCPAKPSIRPRV